MTKDGDMWDAHAEWDVGVLISRYLREHPSLPFRVWPLSCTFAHLSSKTLDGAT
jgi:hypothetical protein